MATTHRTAPDDSLTGMPTGIPYIIGNEACERFSFYGMKAILQVHMTALFAAQMIGEESLANSESAALHAQEVSHLFVAAVYAFPMIGALVADRLLGKYRTIMWLSIVYCLGHGVLAVAENRVGGMYLGLGLIALGAGGIKPCVSAHVGDQFGKGNWGLLRGVFNLFYFSINFGSFIATLLIPWLNARYGSQVAFGLPGVLMFLATVAFWMGRHSFVHVPAKPGGKLGFLDAISSVFLFLAFIGLPLFFDGFSSAIVPDGVSPWLVFFGLVAAFGAVGFAVFRARQKIEADEGFLAIMIHSITGLLKGDNSKIAQSAIAAGEPKDSLKRHWLFSSAAERYGERVAEGPRAVLRIIMVFLLVSIFWALFDQHMTSWIRQAQLMDLSVPLYDKLPRVFQGWLGEKALPSQIQSLNPLMVMLLIPFSTYFLYPTIERFGIKMTPLRRMTIGMFAASLAFVAVALIQKRIDGNAANSVSFLWQAIPYFIMTQAEVMVSITGLEFAYTQAPKAMKSTLMGFFMLSISLGNKLVAVVSGFESLELVNFFWLFAGLMAAAAVLFGVYAMFYKYQDYETQNELA